MKQACIYIVCLLLFASCERPQSMRLSVASGYDNLYTALTNAKAGDTIRISGTVDCSNRKPLELRSSHVTLIGGTLRSSTTYPTVTGALLVNYGTGNKISCLSLCQRYNLKANHNILLWRSYQQHNRTLLI